MHNRISVLKDSDGNWLETHEEIEEELPTFFKDTLKEPNISREDDINQITQHIPRIISEEHKQVLLRPNTLVEVESAVFQLQYCKALGLDGFTSNFFHQF